MKYYLENTTNKVVTERHIVDMNKDKIIPLPLSDDSLLYLDYSRITYTEPPAVTDLQKSVIDNVSSVGGINYLTWAIIDKFQDILNDNGDIVSTKIKQEADYLQTKFKATVPVVITMRQARLALLSANLLTTVNTAIASGTDEALKIEWEYSTECKRDWQSLITMATALGMTDLQLDELFILGATL